MGRGRVHYAAAGNQHQCQPASAKASHERMPISISIKFICQCVSSPPCSQLRQGNTGYQTSTGIDGCSANKEKSRVVDTFLSIFFNLVKIAIAIEKSFLNFFRPGKSRGVNT